MATRVIDDTKLQNIAVAIQGKDSGGTMTVDEMPGRIALIPTQDNTVLNSLIKRTITSIENSEVTSIGSSAFQSCSNLTSASFPNVTSIGSSAFQSCSNLTSASFPNATSIGSSAFQSCSNLTSASFPNVTSIGSSAFQSCSNLTSASFPNATSIGSSAFRDCSNLTSVSFQNVTSIGNSAFRDCTGLTEIDLKNVTTFLNNAHFQSCRSLRKVIGKKVTSTAGSFYDCRVLETVILSNVSTIGYETFLAAHALKNVDCRNVNRIVDKSFKNCSRLSLIDLTSRATPTTLENTGAFVGTNNTWIAVVANDTIKSDFQNTTNWSTFASHFRTIAEVEAEVGMTYDEYYYQLFGEPRNEVTP